MDLSDIWLNRDADRRIRAGHPWVYSNEIDTQRVALTSLTPGQGVRVHAHNGQFLGSGYINPHNLICIRLLSRDAEHPPGKSLFIHRLNQALSLRERFFPTPHYRLVYGDSDGLPGLVVDRFGEVLSVQMNTAGMDAYRAEIIEALDKVIRPQAIVLRNDSAARGVEGLPEAVEVLGTLPSVVSVCENGLTYYCCPRTGQKTGWFYDQADNRRRLAPYAKGASVLDVFSYLGAWGISAGAAGATAVTCVDSSATALEGAAKNAQRNDIPLETLCGDAFEVLKTFREERRRFGVVIVDPPAFIKRRKDLSSGTIAYRRLNQLALPLVEPGGYLITGSCSQHLSAPALLEQVHAAARHVDRQIQVVETGGQSRDHPIHPAIPETAYLKMLFLRVLRN